jgi:gas vesicle protein
MNTEWNSSKNSGVLLALCVGAATGVAVGLLIAKESGGQLRAQISEVVEDYMDSARDKAEQVKNSTVEMSKQAFSDLQRTKDSAVSTGAREAHNAIDKGAKSGHQAVETLQAGARS